MSLPPGSGLRICPEITLVPIVEQRITLEDGRQIAAEFIEADAKRLSFCLFRITQEVNQEGDTQTVTQKVTRTEHEIVVVNGEVLIDHPAAEAFLRLAKQLSRLRTGQGTPDEWACIRDTQEFLLPLIGMIG